MELTVKFALAALVVLSFIMSLLGMAGNTCLLLIAAGYAWYMDFTSLSLNMLGVIAAIYLVGELWEFIVGFLGIKKEKLSWLTVFVIGIGTVIGAVAGTLVLPVLGSLLGATAGSFITALIVEYFFGGNKDRALYIAWVAARNHFLALLGKLVAAAVMALLILQALFF